MAVGNLGQWAKARSSDIARVLAWKLESLSNVRSAYGLIALLSSLSMSWDLGYFCGCIIFNLCFRYL